MKKLSKLETKLKTLPRSSGVYFHKDKNGEIIYVGKAAVLKNRVKQYFLNSRDMDVKTKALVAEIVDTDWVETESEIDALFLEAEMVKRYMPRYNILLRDDKSLIYVRIDMKSDWPYVSFTHNPADDTAEYFGPYYNSFAVKKSLRYLRRIFPYYISIPRFNLVKESHSGLNPEWLSGERLDLDAHLGLAPVGMTSGEYKASLRKLISYIKGNRKTLIHGIEHDMKKAADLQDFETAAKLRNKLFNIRELQRRIVFGDKEFLDISKDIALCELTDLLGLSKIPKRIEGFDISHMSGTNVVASMVVFKNGVSDRTDYRKFKTRIEHNDDFFNMKETLSRRLSEKNLKNWGKPDLILIDGGKGQLDAALQARDESGQPDIPFIGLAKRDEQIVIKTGDGYKLIDLPKSSAIIKLLQRIRDESHRFAVSYHTVLKRIQQTTSLIDEIPGIGSKTRSKLIRKFGSLRGLRDASEPDVAKIIGPSKARLVMSYIKVV